MREILLPHAVDLQLEVQINIILHNMSEGQMHHFHVQVDSDVEAARFEDVISQVPHIMIVDHILVPEVPFVLGQEYIASGLFQRAKEKLAANPRMVASDLMHNWEKPWEVEKIDLAALVLLAEQKLIRNDRLSATALVNSYARMIPFILSRLSYLNRSTPTIAPLQLGEAIFDQLKKSCISYNDDAKRPAEKFKKDQRKGNLLTPSEIRIYLAYGFAGTNFSKHQLADSESINPATVGNRYNLAIDNLMWAMTPVSGEPPYFF